MKRLCLCALASSLAAAGAQAQQIYGGGAYDTSDGTGYFYPQVPVLPGSTAGNGVAVGNGSRYAHDTPLGDRAFRWDASGNPAVELGNLGTDAGGYTSTIAYAVNPTGTAAGYAQKIIANQDFGFRAVRWDANTTVATELDNLGTTVTGNTTTNAFAINSAGTIAGLAEKYTGGVYQGTLAVRWAAGGTAVTELGNLGLSNAGDTVTQAYALNSAGTTVGFANKWVAGNYVGDRAVRWDSTGTAAIDLGTLGVDVNGHGFSIAHDVNDAGVTVGYSDKYVVNTNVGTRAVRWDAGSSTPTELDALGDSPTGENNAGANAINAAGTAVGSSNKWDAGVDVGARAVRWDAGSTTATELGTLGTDPAGYTYAQALDVNASGIAVGEMYEYDDAHNFIDIRAVAWLPDGSPLVLNNLLAPDSGWRTLFTAHSISDTGWITGIGIYDPDGGDPAFSYPRTFLIALPEPASAALFGLTAIALTPRRRHRARVGNRI
jgi:hypothetical protein